MASIIVTKNKTGESVEFFLDDEDFNLINQYKWHLKYNIYTSSWYAIATKQLGLIDGKYKTETIYMTRLIMGLDRNNPLFPDHIDHDTTNNHKHNLRVSDKIQNGQNRKSRNKNNKSGYRNVSFINGKWTVQLQIDGRNITLGKFDDVHEAGRFAEEKRKEYYKNFSGKN